MAKIVIAGICNCPRFAMVEYVAEYLKATLPRFQVHKVILDEGEPWENWLNDVCVRNGWLHDQSPIVWRELLQRGSKGILIGNADDFLEYANAYYGVHLNLPTELLLRYAQENRRLHAEQTLRMQVARDLMHSYTIGVIGACHKVVLMILFEIIRDGTLGPNKTIIVKLFCHPTHGEVLKTIKNDLMDLASPYLRKVIVTEDLESVVKGCNLILWLEEPFCATNIVIVPSSDTLIQQASANLPTRTKPDITEFDKIAGYVYSHTSHQANDLSDFPMIRAHRLESLPTQSIGPTSSSSETFIYQMDLHNLSGASSDLEVRTRRKSVSLEEHSVLTLADKKLSFSASVDDHLLSSSQRTSLFADDAGSSVPIVAKRTSSEQSPKTAISKKVSSSVPQGIFSEIDLRIRSFSEVIGRSVHPDCRIVMAGDDPSLNYCAYIFAHTCPALGPSLIVVSDIEARTKGAIARKMGILPSNIHDLLIWGDPGNDFSIDLSRATVSNYDGAIWKEHSYNRRLESVFSHWKWFKRDLKPFLMADTTDWKPYVTAMRLSNTVVTCLKRWYGDGPSVLTSVGIVSDGSYGIPRGQVMTCPVYLIKGSWQSASLDMSDDMLHKLGRLVNKCFENQLLYLRKLKKEQMMGQES